VAGGQARRRSVPGEQRVFSLVLALVASPQGATKRELLSSVYGYAERGGGEADAALERQFERDKAQLRELGIPIDAIDSPQEPGNNQLTRYRISKELLQMPAGLRFSDRELALLRGAALAWREGSLTAEARRAVMKLEALGAGLDVQHLGVAPQLGITEPAAPALQRGIDEALVARFDYRLPDRDAPLARRVAPLGLHRADGRWHLIAHDLDRDADRVFLLSRICGEVRVGPEAFDPGLRERLGAVRDELLDRERRLRAAVRVRPGSVAEARLAPRARREASGADASLLDLGTLDYHALAAELAAHGDELAVLGPEQLREGTVAILRRVRDQHAGGARPGGEVGADGGGDG
jgi:proteasome accessory factor B